MKKFTIIRTLLMLLKVAMYLAPVLLAVLCFIISASHILQGAMVSAVALGFIGWSMLSAHNDIDKNEM